MVNIFDKPREYRVIIDHGSAEPPNQIKPSHVEHIIFPILRRYIEQKEYAFTAFASDYREVTRNAESQMQMPPEPHRYDSFLEAVIRDIPSSSIPVEAREDPVYI